MYIRNRRSITSFDDFYEFLLRNFDASSSVSNFWKPIEVDQKNEFQKSIACSNKSTTDQKSNVTSLIDSNRIAQLCTCCSNNTFINDATKVCGDVLVTKPSESVSTNDTWSLDSVIPDSRQAIVTDFIKHPKISRDNKDDVIKWLGKIEHIMQIAHVPDSNRLDLIAYSLRGDALQWFRNNKSTLISWNSFIQEFKKAFKSSFCEELAFKTLGIVYPEYKSVGS